MSLTITETEAIRTWFDQRGLTLNQRMIDKIATYGDLLASWSRRMNLISKKDLDHWVERHFLDSLTPIESIPESGSLIDVGSGAGFPGIPLAFVRPYLRITLVESIHKKTLFLKAVIRDLGLGNVNIMESRLENIQPPPSYDVVTIRALPGWQNLITRLKSLLNPGGNIILYLKRGTWRVLPK